MCEWCIKSRHSVLFYVRTLYSQTNCFGLRWTNTHFTIYDLCWTICSKWVNSHWIYANRLLCATCKPHSRHRHIVSKTISIWKWISICLHILYMVRLELGRWEKNTFSIAWGLIRSRNMPKCRMTFLVELYDDLVLFVVYVKFAKVE